MSVYTSPVKKELNNARAFLVRLLAFQQVLKKLAFENFLLCWMCMSDLILTSFNPS